METLGPPGIEPGTILTVNGGSSSIRFALYDNRVDLACRLQGKIDRIGLPGTTFDVDDHAGGRHEHQVLRLGDHLAAAVVLLGWLEQRLGVQSIGAIGHRVVHGMHYTAPQLVTPQLLARLRSFELYDPDHLPAEISLIEAFSQRDPARHQVVCFDTAFHHTMPRVATILPIPRRYQARGIRRYGFHGLSYAYLMEALVRVAGPQAAGARVVLAHLGNGASLAAVRDGKSMDTSMGFTPAAGLPMGSRSGDLDPGLAPCLNRLEAQTVAQFAAMVNQASGLLGISETSADMRDLLAIEGEDIRAAEAVALFCYQAKKWVGAYAAALGGLDTLVFTGGIGENAAQVRSRICAGLGFLGIEIDEARNAAHAEVISADASRVTVRVIPTDEELMIARSVRLFLRSKGRLPDDAPGPQFPA